MKNLKIGDKVRAKVFGFSRPAKPFFDLEGQTVVAWTDLPLAIGRVVTAVVEDSDEGRRLRVRGPGGRSGEESGSSVSSGHSVETLETMIAVTAAEFGLDDTGGTDPGRGPGAQGDDARPRNGTGPAASVA